MCSSSSGSPAALSGLERDACALLRDHLEAITSDEGLAKLAEESGREFGEDGELP